MTNVSTDAMVIVDDAHVDQEQDVLVQVGNFDGTCEGQNDNDYYYDDDYDHDDANADGGIVQGMLMCLRTQTRMII